MEHLLMSSNQSGSTELDNDESAWIAAARSDPAAFEPLYLRYRTRLYRYLRLRLPNDEDAADVTHQVFLIALDSLPKYQQRGLPFAAWLFRIAHHVAANTTRRQRPTVSWDALPETLLLLDDPGPEAWAMQQERLSHLRTWLSRLSAEKRELLALRFAGGLTVPQIAGAIGKKPDAVKKQLSRLLQSYREHYHHEH